MKFRFRILSANKRRQQDVRNFGLLLLIIGFCLHDPGQSSLKYLGILMLLWSGMSWLAQKAWEKGWFQDSTWVHVSALAVLILLDTRVGHVVRVSESAIATFSGQLLQQELPKPPEKPKPIAKFDHGDSIRSIAFSPVDASRFVSVGGDTIKLWHQNAPDAPDIFQLAPYTDAVDSVAFSFDGERLAASGKNGITLWSVREKRLIKAFDDGAALVAFSPDGQRLAKADWDLDLWDIIDGNTVKKNTLFKHREHHAFVQSIAFSPDGKWLVSGDAQGDVKVWDVQEGRAALAPLKGGDTRIRSLKFFNNENNLILASAGSDGAVKFWRTQDWQITHTISTGTVLDLAFSPHGKTFASLGWRTIDVWGVESGARLISFKKRARSVAFSPNGTTIATGSTDGMLRLWDVTSATIARRFERQDVVRIVYFLPKGSRPQLNIQAKIDKILRKVQRFYGEQMETYGFGRKSFVFETDAKRKAKVYFVTGKLSAEDYLENTLTKVGKEISKHFDTSRNVYFVVVELGSKRIDDNVCGQGRINSIWSGGEVWQARVGLACIPTFKNCFNWETAAHEIGHAFGLKHDFRDAQYIMSYSKSQNRLSRCAAHWLDQSRFFEFNQPFYNARATIEMQQPSQPSEEGATVVNHQTPPVFRVTDADGIHQIQLLVPPTNKFPPPGYKLSGNDEQNSHSWEETKREGKFILHSFREVDGEKRAAIALPDVHIKKVRVQAMDMHGNITWRSFDISEHAAESPEHP